MWGLLCYEGSVRTEGQLLRSFDGFPSCHRHVLCGHRPGCATGVIQRNCMAPRVPTSIWHSSSFFPPLSPLSLHFEAENASSEVETLSLDESASHTDPQPLPFAKQVFI